MSWAPQSFRQDFPQTGENYHRQDSWGCKLQTATWADLPKRRSVCRTHGCVTERKDKRCVLGENSPRELEAFRTQWGSLSIFISSSLYDQCHLLPVFPCTWWVEDGLHMTPEGALSQNTANRLASFSPNSKFPGQRIWWTQVRSAMPTRFRNLRS